MSVLYNRIIQKLTVAGARVEHPFPDGEVGRGAGGAVNAVEHVGRVPYRTHERRSLRYLRVVRRQLSVVGHWSAQRVAVERDICE